MDVQFYRSEQLIKKYYSVKSGEVSLEWAPPGAIEIKLWVPGSGTSLDSISVNVAPPQVCAEAKLIIPNGIRDSYPTPIPPAPTELPIVPSTTRIEWTPSDCKMDVQFYRYATLTFELKDKTSGEVGLGGLNGQTEIKIWVSEASTPSDSMQINVVEP